MSRRAARVVYGATAFVVLAGAPAALHAQQDTTAVELITSELTRGLDLPFSEAARVGDLIFLSGMIGIRPGTMQLVSGGMEAEARQTLDNVRAMLRAAGAVPRDVVKCTVMLEDMADWPAFNRIYVEFFGAHRPARSALGADGLALGAKVELECIARAPRSAPEATSLLGERLYPPALPADERARLEQNLADARARYERTPDDADALIWLGRRLGYLWRYRDAVAVFTEGIRRHPEDARMYRHRGHRYITLRRFNDAIRDLEHAARLVHGKPDEVEPDGAPNAQNIPTSTLQSNIWYHLGLAHYLKGDFARALNAWREAMKVSANDDMRVATSDWLYMTLRRLGREEEAARVLAPIHRELRILENHAYHRRLLMYKGELAPDALLSADAAPLDLATQGYGVGNWHLYNGRPERAREIFQRVVDGSHWAAFGYIAAEAELARLR